MPTYQYRTAPVVPGALIRWDSDTNGTPANVTSSGGTPIAQQPLSRYQTSSYPEGVVPIVYGTDATVYLRQVSPFGQVQGGVLATIIGVDVAVPAPNPGGGTVDKASVINTGVTAADIGGKTAAQSDAAYAPRWQANTAYTAGQAVVLPDGTTGTAKANFTSGATFSAINWNVASGGAAIDDTAASTTKVYSSTKAASTFGTVLRATSDYTDNLGRLNSTLAAGTPVQLARGLAGEQWWVNGTVMGQPSTPLLLGAGVGLKLASKSNCWLFATPNQDGSRISDVTFIGQRGSYLKPQHGALLAADAAAGSTTLTLDRHPGTDLPYPVGLYLGESFDSNKEAVTVTGVTGSGPTYTATLAAPTTGTHLAANVAYLTSQFRVQADRYKSAVLQPLNVDGLRMGGFKIFGGNFVTVNPQGCTDFDIFDIALAADDVTPNQDGIDPFGCSKGRIRTITGHTGDDFSYVMSQVTTPAVHPVLRAGGASPMVDTYDIEFSNITVDPAGNGIRLIAGDSLAVRDVRGSNITFNKTGFGPRLGSGKFAALRMGTNTASGPATPPTAAQFGDVKMQITSRILRGLLLDYPCNDVTLDWTCKGTTKPPLLDRENTTASTFSRIRVVEHSTDDTNAADASISPVVVWPASSTVDGLDLEVDTATITGLLGNAGTITGLKVKAVHAKRQVGDLFTGTLSAVQGDVNNVTIDTVVSGATLAGAGGAAALRFGPQAPILTSADATPQAVKGSQIACAASKNPVGDAVGGGGLYYGTGSLWVRLASDLVTPVAPTATALSGRNVVTWGDLGYSTYKVYRSDAPTTSLGTVATRSFVDTTGATGTAYTYTYEPLDGSGNPATSKSAASNSVTTVAQTLFVNDTFTDTAGVALNSHTGETGATWAKHPQGTVGPTIDSNGTLYQSAAASSNHYASGSPASADYAVTADWKFVTLIAASTVGIYGRLSTTALTAYWLRYSVAVNAWQLYKQVANTATLLATYTPGTAVAAGETHTASLVMVGNTVIAVVDGLARVTVNDGDVTVANKIGIQFGGQAASATTGIHLDNLKAA